MKFHGYSGAVTLAQGGIVHLSKWTMSVDTDIARAKSFNTVTTTPNYEEAYRGFSRVSGTLEGHLDSTTAIDFTGTAAVQEKQTATLTDGDGNDITLSIIMGNVTVENPVDGMATLSATFEADGAPS